ncbi:NADP-dependent 3-hydroxy acid dehydrogenase YdfG [Deinobacterium chartae]|uniref:NADP-dependent 3-hydroxy acid dehydrogenase YdfG n=1 Tax=Deinobacterium chartae TaxID=521158 RepID=A0A841I2S6_9DEIO|nr:SDR family NAD(P)-dependent oxidoreductase [Deinobacterium chartae]MBB6098352.1 NADP-dependent 3-hydroxy acid dehydrogenase YdfG [Deinobacterium chartae]
MKAARTLGLTALAMGGLMLASRARAPQFRPLGGKVVVITGASSGIGRATALECAARGARVVLAARHPEGLERVAGEVRALGAEALVVPTDVRERAQVEALADAALEAFGRIDVWFNNAGMAFVADVADSPEDRIEQLLQVQVWGVIYGVQAAVRVMRPQGDGHIINMASIAGRVGFPKMGIYAGSKAFVEVMTQVLRQELMVIDRSGIRVSAVQPTAVRTPFFDKAPNLEEGGQGAYLTGPVLEADQVARAVVDAMERYRAVVLPLRPVAGLQVMYDLAPALTDRVMSLFRPDRRTAGFNARHRGSGQDEAPVPPRVEGTQLTR